MTRSVVGALGASARAEVDGRGRVTMGDVTFGWWIGADDRWHIPAEAPGLRQQRLGPAPAYETRVRVPSGDAVQRVYAAPDALVIEFENDSPAPFALALVVGAGRRDAALTGSVLDLGRCQVTFSQAPRYWAAGASTREVVTSGAATATAEGETTWRAPGEVTLLVPVAHRTRLRVVVSTEAAADVPELDAVLRGWSRHLDRGLRTELPDPLQERIDAARADLLLAAPNAAVAAALEDWGFDHEFETAWARLGLLARRAARRRAEVADPWSAVQSTILSVDLLAAVRALLVREAADHVAVLPTFPTDWRGANLAVHDIPLRSGGTLSYALRWHGDRPALLWEAPAGVQLRAPVLAPEWRADGGAGEAMVS